MAETPHRDIPHLRIVVGACIAAIGGYAAFSVYAVIWMKDPGLTGDIIGTWKSFAVLAFGFWLGSSSGGKAKDEKAVVQIDQPADKPVPTTDESKGERP